MSQNGLSMDIGGTLAKVVVYIPSKKKDSDFAKFFFEDNIEANTVFEEELQIETKKGTLYFIKFLSSDVPKFLNSSKIQNVTQGIKKSSLFATGG